VFAARADERRAKEFLEANGFKGVKFRKAVEDSISFHYESYDKKYLEQHLGKPTLASGGQIIYKFGTAGNIFINEAQKFVALKNKGGAQALSPIETHVPAPKAPTVPPKLPEPKEEPKKEPTALPPTQSPNVPGAKDNDDSQVPVTHIPEQLQKMYAYAQGTDNSSYRLQFMKKLWHYFNSAKFGNRLQEPNFRLLKNQAASKMRLRGRWWPNSKLLEMAPRTFNASQNFFNEIFLHEMCHQATTQIDAADGHPEERRNKGHGPIWQKWMKHVGLNPLRFDPNDNSTYMTYEERGEHEAKKERLKEAVEEIKEKGLRRMWRIDDPCWATVLWNGRIYNGMVAAPTGVNRAKYAFVDTKEYLHGTRFMLVPATCIFEFAGSEEERNKVKDQMERKIEMVRSHYVRKKEIRQMKKYYRTGLGF